MTKEMIGPNDSFSFEIAKLRDLMKAAENQSWMDKIDAVPEAKTVRIDFKQGEKYNRKNDFIEPVSTVLDGSGKPIYGTGLKFNERDMLYLISNVDDVVRTKGEQAPKRDVNSPAVMGFFAMKDGDVYRIPLKDYLLNLSQNAHPDYLKNAELMKEYGIKHILMVMRYPDDRKMSSLKNFSPNNVKNQKYFLDPYYSPSLELFATDEYGTFFFEGVDSDIAACKTAEERRPLIAESVMASRLNHAIETDWSRIEESKVFSNSYMVLDSKSMELLLNDDNIYNRARLVGNAHNDEYAFTSIADIHQIVSKAYGFKVTAQAGDEYSLFVKELSEPVKAKYGFTNEVENASVNIVPLERDDRYCDIQLSMKDKEGDLLQQRSLMKHELNEILCGVRAGMGFTRSEEPKQPYYAIKNEAHVLTENAQGDVVLGEAYMVNISELEARGNTELNATLNKLKALGNDKVLVSMKFDFDYIPNGHTDALGRKFNSMVGFDASHFPEMNVYGFDNEKGQAYDPDMLKATSMEEIKENADKVRGMLVDSALKNEHNYPRSAMNYESASLHTLGVNDVFALIDDNDLKHVDFNKRTYQYKSEFNITCVNKAAQSALKLKSSGPRPH
ncbi:hypothetical protein [Serratia sp. Se-RSBMAAmG]|uniref:hypothetical protein n=1 Tax=Serratia sp. Se-RSBMAAmG TaxID=3043305 RepID=UPI0024AEB35A|nr:hypothetical protein [Serratia sp. Se-RSBMAAmG]MDI6977196.1 hypothetical protein [Serratia sp. Se-RSBMAAmG]